MDENHNGDKIVKMEEYRDGSGSEEGSSDNTQEETEVRRLFKKRLEKILKTIHNERPRSMPSWADLDINYIKDKKRVEIVSNEFNFSSYTQQKTPIENEIENKLSENWDKISEGEPPVEEVRLVDPEAITEIEEELTEVLSKQEIYLEFFLPDDWELSVTDAKESYLEVSIQGDFDLSEKNHTEVENVIRAKIDMRLNSYDIEDLQIIDKED
ncbi:MAG: hypothetical protein ABEJ02_00990 [Candidatus Paceibacteria bacterium]